MTIDTMLQLARSLEDYSAGFDEKATGAQDADNPDLSHWVRCA